MNDDVKCEQREDTTLRPVPNGYDGIRCEWQECHEVAVFVRDTQWGDLPVCRAHSACPLE